MGAAERICRHSCPAGATNGYLSVRTLGPIALEGPRASDMLRTSFLTALLLLLPGAASADAASRTIVRGAGWGHGAGMCQYGAYGFAQHGRTYRQILAHYYQGSEIGKAPSSNVRVLLQSGRRAIAFRGATRASGGVKLRASKTYRAVRSGSRVELRTSGGQRVGRFSAPLIVTSRPDVTRLRGTAISGKRDGRYRGLIAIWPSGAGGVSAVNHASIDDYVKGVVPGEMPPTWHVEAVKSQAVAARSYALATKKPGATFDLYPDTRSQVYRGYDGEHANANQAVDRTAREVVTHDGKVAVTYFFSTSGGETENVENVFYGARPTSYLRGVDDPYD